MAQKGTIISRFPIAEIEAVSRRAIGRAAKEVAVEIENYIVEKCSRPNPSGKSPSKAGQYPKMVTAEFVSGVKVSGTANGVTVYSLAPHGSMLETGTTNMAARPWATKALNARQWMNKIAKLARQYTGGSRKPATRR